MRLLACRGLLPQASPDRPALCGRLRGKAAKCGVVFIGDAETVAPSKVENHKICPSESFHAIRVLIEQGIMSVWMKFPNWSSSMPFPRTQNPLHKGRGFCVFGLWLAHVAYSCISAAIMKFLNMVANCALVALPAGAKLLSPMPLTIPARNMLKIESLA